MTVVERRPEDILYRAPPQPQKVGTGWWRVGVWGLGGDVRVAQERDVAVLRRDAHRKAAAILSRTVFPLRVGQVTVRSIGSINSGKNYHSNFDIWPVKYRSEREHISYLDSSLKVVYTSEILDGGDSPIFRVTAADDPTHPLTAPSASRVWQSVRGHGVRCLWALLTVHSRSRC